MNKKNIFITGVTSKIGRHLVDRLDLSKYCIYALYRSRSRITDPRLNFVYGDLSDPAGYSSVFNNNIDAVVHLGAVTHTNDIDKYYRINAEATVALIKLCESKNVKRFIFVSTRAISDNGGPYSRSKSIGEMHVKGSALNWVILRLSEVYGVSGNEGVDLILDTVKKMPVIPVVGSGEYSLAPVHISDAVLAIKTAIEKEDIKNKIYTIAGPENFTCDAFIDKAMKLNNVRKAKIHIPEILVKIFLKFHAMVSDDDTPPVMVQLPRLLSGKSYDITEASRDLDFRPFGLENFIGKNE